MALKTCIEGCVLLNSTLIDKQFSCHNQVGGPLPLGLIIQSSQPRPQDVFFLNWEMPWERGRQSCPIGEERDMQTKTIE